MKRLWQWAEKTFGVGGAIMVSGVSIAVAGLACCGGGSVLWAAMRKFDQVSNGNVIAFVVPLFVVIFGGVFVLGLPAAALLAEWHRSRPAGKPGGVIDGESVVERDEPE